jgi:hypothetical protein
MSVVDLAQQMLDSMQQKTLPQLYNQQRTGVLDCDEGRQRVKGNIARVENWLQRWRSFRAHSPGLEPIIATANGQLTMLQQILKQLQPTQPASAAAKQQAVSGAKTRTRAHGRGGASTAAAAA